MKIGDKVRILKELHPNGIDKYIHYNKVATILEEPNGLRMVKVSIDDFPNCNYREYYNQFWHDIDELELL